MPISKIKTSSITADAASVNLNIDANTLFLDVANNRVGVNTTSPAEALQVNSSSDSVVRITSTAASGKAYNLTSGGNGNYSPGVFAIRNVTDSTTPFAIFGDNVGIGTTGPGAKLHVVGADGTQGNEFNGFSVSGTTAPTKRLTFAYDNANDAGVIAAVHTGTAWKNIYIPFGNLGLGTSTPGSIKLHIVKNDPNAYSTTNFNNQTSVFINNTTAGGYSNLVLGAASSGNGSAAYAGIAVISTASNDTNSALIFGIRGGGGPAMSEAMRIDSSGQVILDRSANTGGGKLDLVANSGSNAAIQARSTTTGTGDGTADVTVTRAVTNGASWWANARYDAYSHAWGYGGGATAATAMRINGSGQLLLKTANATANTTLTLDGSGANGGADISQIYTGAVKNTSNMGNGAVILHKLGQSQGLQFSGKVICNSWTGQAYIDVHIIARYTDDAVSYQVMQASTLNPGTVGKVVLQLSTVTISGVSGTFLAITKNGGGTGTMAVNGFCQNNVGFFYEVAGGSYTVASTIATLN